MQDGEDPIRANGLQPLDRYAEVRGRVMHVGEQAPYSGGPVVLSAEQRVCSRTSLVQHAR
jgi:hypothetical protein